MGFNPLTWITDSVVGIVGDKILKGYEDTLASHTSAGSQGVDLAKASILADIQARANAKEIRLATAGDLGVRVLFFVLGAAFTLHVAAICVGTTFAPLLSSSSWLLHIPPLPAPFDAYEASIIGFFFGSAVAMTGVQAIAGALARRA